ncbi:PR domain zinc finger protein 5-like isoform X2 [Condylostylus longicornis]|uniref:PR domain zinc finger protein 5-like isoform X2 n=1 Tax=Condylostylus longicornis TaxID=2530218 RepID=UPI00244DD0BB|nr:PR domain zinc finger protein 5-like isoform X2 [Condylostylus longicornis]
MICFLCLKKSEALINIYDGLEEGFISLNIPNIIEKHVCFKPDKENPMLCKNCWLIIESFYIFCLNIKKAHNGEEERKSEYDIKPELKCEVEEAISSDHLSSICDNEDTSFCVKNEDDVIRNVEKISRCRLSRQCKNKLLTKNEIINVHNGNEIEKEKLNASSREELFIKDVEKQNVDSKDVSTKKRKRSTVVRNADAVDQKISKYMTLSCDICGEQSPTLAALKSHFRLIHQENGYAVCCNRKFKKRYLLIDHIDCHLNPDHFKCGLCDKTFSVADSLRNHMRDIHEARERVLVQCDQCPKKFIRKSILLRHKAYHLPVETWAFPCDECGKIFPSKFYLRSHKSFSHNSLPTKICYICGKPVPTSRYKKHMRSHDSKNEEEKVECEICKAKLNKKYIKVHSITRKRKKKIFFVQFVIINLPIVGHCTFIHDTHMQISEIMNVTFVKRSLKEN